VFKRWWDRSLSLSSQTSNNLRPEESVPLKVIYFMHVMWMLFLAYLSGYTKELLI
jgi:hypothetical protein